MEAQRYPQDFDGIIAGAPVNYRTNLSIWSMSMSVAALRDKESFLPSEKLTVLNKAVVSACDALDGVKDGLLSDPRQCHFDPSTVSCRAGDAENCLTAHQVETARKIYGPLKTKTGELIFPGLAPGGELGWATLIGRSEPRALFLTAFKYVIHEDPKWDWQTFDAARDLELVQKKLAMLNAIDPNLQAFKSRGGKLLMYHGWNDPLVSPQNSINYHSSVLAKLGARQDNWQRLFLAPGMAHCGGGEGPNRFDGVTALEQWVEHGKAPSQIIASHSTGGKVDRTRPLCPYPQIARYQGSGSIDEAANFTCMLP